MPMETIFNIYGFSGTYIEKSDTVFAFREQSKRDNSGFGNPRVSVKRCAAERPMVVDAGYVPGESFIEYIRVLKGRRLEALSSLM